VLGKLYEDEGPGQARAVLADLAVHPATATHVARKLAAHFIADTPPPALVERMAKSFLDSAGDLKEVTRTMVKSDEAWTESGPSSKPPGRMGRRHGASCRLHADRRRAIHGGQALLGEPLWRPTSPRVFPTTKASWIDGMGRRLDIANNVAERAAGKSIPTRSSAACWRP